MERPPMEKVKIARGARLALDVQMGSKQLYVRLRVPEQGLAGDLNLGVIST